VARGPCRAQTEAIGIRLGEGRACLHRVEATGGSPIHTARNKKARSVAGLDTVGKTLPCLHVTTWVVRLGRGVPTFCTRSLIQCGAYPLGQLLPLLSARPHPLALLGFGYAHL